MEMRLNLIKTDLKQLEKRILPRFPLCAMTFREKGRETGHTYEVKEISSTGMQLGLKHGPCGPECGDSLSGELHWRGERIVLRGLVKWSKGLRLGVQFERGQEAILNSFICLENLVCGLRPVHLNPVGIELPANLRCWLSGDGPLEFFIWQHGDGEIARIQAVMLNHFVEWEDGRGIKTGRVMTLRDVDTPLINEDEFIFQLDEYPSKERLEGVREFLSLIPAAFLNTELRDFAFYKFR